MINHNSRQLDQYDVGLLFAAMVKVNESELAEEADRSLVQIGYDEGLARATCAANFAAVHHQEEGENSDGVWWFEIFEQDSEGSLAHQLFLMEVTEKEHPAQWARTIREMVLEWLYLHQGLRLFAINNEAGETLFCVQCEDELDIDACIPEGLEDKFETGQCYIGIAATFEDYTVYMLPEQAAEVTARFVKGE